MSGRMSGAPRGGRSRSARRRQSGFGPLEAVEEDVLGSGLRYRVGGLGIFLSSSHSCDRFDLRPGTFRGGVG
jgi:hypothetical protein